MDGIRRWISRWLVAAAALARSVAAALGRSALDPADDQAMAALRDRFPGAPDHWLRMIAERAPQLAAAVPEDEVLRGPAPPPFLSAISDPATPPQAVPMADERRSERPVPQRASPHRRADPHPTFGWTSAREAIRHWVATRRRHGRPSLPNWPAIEAEAAAMPSFDRAEARTRQSPSWSPWPVREPKPETFAPADTSKRQAIDFADREPAVHRDPDWTDIPPARPLSTAPWPPLPKQARANASFDTQSRRAAPEAPTYPDRDRSLRHPAAWHSVERRTVPRHSAAPAAPPHHRWPALPPITAEIDEVEAVSLRLSELVGEQEGGRWSA